MRSRITHRVACDRGIPSRVSRKLVLAVGPILFTSVLLACVSLLQRMLHSKSGDAWSRAERESDEPVQRADVQHVAWVGSGSLLGSTG